MRLRVAAFRNLIYGDTTLRGGDEFDVPDEAGAHWLSTGLVVPADGIWPDGVRHAPSKPPKPRTASPDALPAAPAGTYVKHDPCEPTGRVRAVCSVAGCPCQVSTSGECPECRRIHNRHRTRKAEHKAYQRADWQRTRTAYLRAHPLCECEDCALIASPLRPDAQVVDHIDGLGPLGPRGYDWANLRSMAKVCHDKRTMNDQVHRDS